MKKKLPAPFPKSLINSPFMKIVLLKYCRTYELHLLPSIYHIIHLTELQLIFSFQTLPCWHSIMHVFPCALICYGDNEGCIGCVTAIIR